MRACAAPCGVVESRPMNDGNRKTIGERIGEAFGFLSFGALQVFALVWGVARFFGIYAYTRERWGLGSFAAFLASFFLCEIPVVSHVLAVLGGIVAYGLAWYWSALIFAPEATVGVVILCGILVAFPFVLLASLIRGR